MHFRRSRASGLVNLWCSDRSFFPWFVAVPWCSYQLWQRCMLPTRSEELVHCSSSRLRLDELETCKKSS